MPATFLPLTAGNIDQALSLMAKLYALDRIPFDAVRARRAMERLLAEPEFGGVWTIDVEGARAGWPSRTR